MWGDGAGVKWMLICSLNCSLQHTWMCLALWRCLSCQGESVRSCCCRRCCVFACPSVCVPDHSQEGKRILCIRNGARYRGRGWDHMWNLEQLNMLSYWLPERATCAVMYDAKWMSEWGMDGSEGRVGGGGCRRRCGSSIWTVSIQVHKCLITRTAAVSLCFLWFHDHRNAPDAKSTLADFRFLWRMAHFWRSNL